MSTTPPQGVAGGGASTTEQVTTVTNDYTASDGEVVLADASNGPLTITLHDPDSGAASTIKKIDATANTVTIARPDGEDIDGDANDRTITGEDTARTFAADGTNYFII